jgi:hypothetical protein
MVGGVTVLVGVSVLLADRDDAVAGINVLRHQGQVLEPVALDAISVPCGLGNHGDQRFLGDQLAPDLDVVQAGQDKQVLLVEGCERLSCGLEAIGPILGLHDIPSCSACRVLSQIGVGPLRGRPRHSPAHRGRPGAVERVLPSPSEETYIDSLFAFISVPCAMSA